MVRNNIIRVQNGGEFFTQMLHVVGDRIRNFFCVANGMGTISSTIGEMLGKNSLRQLGPLQYKQTVLCWSLEQQ